MDDKTITYRDDSRIINKINNVGDDEVLNKKYEVYSYKFPNNSIYVGFTPYGLDAIHYNHSKCGFSPVYQFIKEYPDVYPQVEVTIENVSSYNEIHKIQRKIFDSNLNMKILNENLRLYGY